MRGEMVTSAVIRREDDEVFVGYPHSASSLKDPWLYDLVLFSGEAARSAKGACTCGRFFVEGDVYCAGCGKKRGQAKEKTVSPPRHRKSPVHDVRRKMEWEDLNSAEQMRHLTGRLRADLTKHCDSLRSSSTDGKSQAHDPLKPRRITSAPSTLRLPPELDEYRTVTKQPEPAMIQDMFSSFRAGLLGKS